MFTRGVFFSLQPKLLDLSGNHLNHSHAHTLSIALEHPESSIQSLILDFNSFSFGIQQIAASLTKPNNQLRLISLNHCTLGDNETAPLLNALNNTHCRLRSLSLNNNFLTTDSIFRIIESSHTIKGKSIHINIDHNFIPLYNKLPQIKESIRQHLPQSPTLSLPLKPFNRTLLSQIRRQYGNLRTTTPEQKTATA